MCRSTSPPRRSVVEAARAHAAFVALASSTLSACVGASRASEPGVAQLELPNAPTSAPRAGAGATTEPRGAPVRGTPLTDYSLGQLASAKIGTPCRPLTDERHEETCGTRERVALQVWKSVGAANHPEELPCEPQPMLHTIGTDLVSACIDEGHLYLSEVCVVCRVPTAQAYYAKLDELRPQQHLALATKFRRDAVAPKSAAEWRRLLDEERAHAEP